MSKTTFRSYVNFAKEKEENELRELALTSHNVMLEPDLLPGELVIAECQGVLRFNNYTERNQGVSGALFVTNFKISFVSIDKVTKPDNAVHRRNLLLTEDDISLSCIDAVYQVSKGRKRKLLPSTGLSGQVKKVEIYCKDFRIHRFSFKFLQLDGKQGHEKGIAKKVLQAILHHAFPPKDKAELLFAFEYGGRQETPPGNNEYETRMFDKRNDWEKELERCKANLHWRITVANERYEISLNLPEFFVVPRSLTNNDLTKGRVLFVENRVPTWSYTFPRTGASLIRMANLDANVAPEFKQQESEMLKHIGRSHPRPSADCVREIDLSQVCPLAKDLQANFEKMKDLCMPGSLKTCQSSESSWYSSLETSHWLDSLSACLSVTNDVVKLMREQKSVVLRESTCDMSAVIASLVQICLDPYCRTFQGFQSLVQKEFVSMGFHFLDRCGHMVFREEESPVFLLFLDCVWQLQRQFPTSFAFSETYLTSLWDSTHNCLFGTFIFNNRGHRTSKTVADSFNHVHKPLVEVWDLENQFSEEHLTLFKNPLFTAREAIASGDSAAMSNGETADTKSKGAPKSLMQSLNNSFANLSSNVNPERILMPQHGVADMVLWSQCYLRWLFPVQIVNGGAPSQYFQQCLLVEEILQLHQQICQMKTRPSVSLKKTSSDLIFGLDTPQVTQLLDSEVLTSSFPFSSAHSNAPFLATPLRAFVHQSDILNGKASGRDSSFRSYLDDSAEEGAENEEGV